MRWAGSAGVPRPPAFPCSFFEQPEHLLSLENFSFSRLFWWRRRDSVFDDLRYCFFSRKT